MSYSEKFKEWENRIAAFQRSGKSMRRWCREQEIPYERMKYWKNRIKERAALTECECVSEVPVGWAQVPSTLTIDDPQPDRATGNIYIHIRDIAVEVSKGFDAGTLREVLSAVQKPW